MAPDIRIFENESVRQYTMGDITGAFSSHHAEGIRLFHQGFPQYQPTPLYTMDGLATALGLQKVWVKDESYRFGLNAFKVLGASYAIAHAVGERLRLPADENFFRQVKKKSVSRKLTHLTFVTATDGNHGRAVAWTAEQLGCRCVVYMPRGSAAARVEAIRSHGAQVHVVDGNYDAAVGEAARMALSSGWILTQDTETEADSRMPFRIMQGYTTMMEEVFQQTEGVRPTHVLAQCGVGSFAAAVLAWLVEKYRRDCPVFIVVEPEKAACFYTSARSGQSVTVEGELDTIMAGLACGTPNPAAWKILQAHANFFVVCADAVTMNGMRTLAQPQPGDPAIVSGESGAVTAGFLEAVMADRQRGLVEKLQLTTASRVLLISTEGATDPVIYRKITR